MDMFVIDVQINMQIEFKKEQIVKDKPQSILIDYVEYKLSLPKWMIKNNSFIADDKYTYWVGWVTLYWTLIT